MINKAIIMNTDYSSDVIFASAALSDFFNTEQLVAVVGVLFCDVFQREHGSPPSPDPDGFDQVHSLLSYSRPRTQYYVLCYMLNTPYGNELPVATTTVPKIISVGAFIDNVSPQLKAGFWLVLHLLLWYKRP